MACPLAAPLRACDSEATAFGLPGGERLIGCYDGHCGELCAQYCKDRLHETLQAQPTFGDDATVGEALQHRAPAPRPQTLGPRS